MRTAVTLRATALLGLFLVVPAARGDEEKVELKDVPRAVLDGVKARFPDATIKGAEKEVEDGETTYEVSLTRGGKHVDVSLKSDGKILEIETELAAADLPKPVKDALAARFPKSTLRSAEEILEFEDGKEEKEYEVVLTTADKKTLEVVVEPDGKIEKVEDKGDDKDK